ncbi:hypothetical protein ACPYIV_17095 [Parabacteroides sp. ASD2025]|uniref:hypothetical protein n=1 Tax=Parabacteroides sp. ASD2025 TaxID=3415987 RepID=UPI003CF4C617
MTKFFIIPNTILLYVVLISLLPFQAKGFEPVKGNEITVNYLSFSCMNTHQNDGNDFLKYTRKAKQLKVAGGISLGLGLGTLLFWGALRAAANSTFSDPIDAGLLATSIGLCGASVPLFVCSSKSKKKALSIGAGSQFMPVPTMRRTIRRQQPAIAVRIDF